MTPSWAAKALLAASASLIAASTVSAQSEGYAAVAPVSTPCSTGYSRDVSGTCQDVNECQRIVFLQRCDGANAVCRNTLGSFKCVCKPGYTVQNRRCAPTAVTCRFPNGRVIGEGQSAPAADGCNTCKCTNGGLACTKIACDIGVPFSVCKTPTGAPMQAGQTVRAADGCNTCTCTQSGLQCTKMACAGNLMPIVTPVPASGSCRFANGTLVASGTRVKDTDGCNWCTCANGGLACTKMACAGPLFPGVAPGPTPSLPPGSCRLANGTLVASGTRVKDTDGCNWCTCVSGGLACTKVACVVIIPTVAPTVTMACVSSTGTRLSVGQTVKAVDGCNTCTCTQTGLACTKMGCVGSLLPIVTPVPAPGSCRLANGTYVVSGTRVSAGDGCNTCSCVNSRLACTKMACDVGVVPPVAPSTFGCVSATGAKITVGQTAKAADGCNMCICTQTGLQCTKMGCLSPLGGPIPAPGSCRLANGTSIASGSRVKDTDGCNWCTCTNGGLACTKIACDISVIPTAAPTITCVSATGAQVSMGQTVKAADGCNTCTCTQSGLACTKMACVGPLMPILTPVPSPGSCRLANGTLVASGSRARDTDGCNWCTCTNGGLACTKMACTVPLIGAGLTNGGVGQSAASIDETCLTPDREIVENGQTVPAGDGCNTCTCADGALDCTKNECENGQFEADVNV